MVLLVAVPVRLSWCRDKNHDLFGNTNVILANKGLLHESVRSVVLATVTGEDFGLTLNDPFGGAQ